MAFYETLRKYLLNVNCSARMAGLRLAASSAGPRLYFIRRATGGAVGSLATHFGAVLVCGNPGVPRTVQKHFRRRFGALKLHRGERSRMWVWSCPGMELPQTKGKCTSELQPIPTSPKLWASPHRPLSVELARYCRQNVGEFGRLATVSWPDIFALLAQLRAQVKSLEGDDVYRMNDLIKRTESW